MRSEHLTWSPDGKELLYRKTVGNAKLLFKINLDSHIETQLARLGPTQYVTRHNTGWDWFDPKVLPVAPQTPVAYHSLGANENHKTKY